MADECCAMRGGRMRTCARRPGAGAVVLAACAAVFVGGCGDGGSSGGGREPGKSAEKEQKPAGGSSATGGSAGEAEKKKEEPRYAEVTVKPNTGLPTTEATIGGKKFKLEVAATPESRRIGMMARESIDESGGMVFVFPPSLFMVQNFWMGDCLTDMDILYLDEGGRILTMHEMKVERRLEGESDRDYDARAKKYSSRYRCGLAVELAPGSIRRLKLKEGDLVRMDIAGLKKQAK